MTDHKLALVGFGSVGRAFVRLLQRQARAMEQDYGIAWRVVGIATRSLGIAIDHSGIDLTSAEHEVDNGGTLRDLNAGLDIADTQAFIDVCDADILFENSSLNPYTGQPALDHIRAALKLGMNVVTANKGPVVHGFSELRELARSARVHFFFESTIMDGTPIFSTFREGLPVSKVLGFRGVLNSTTNAILSEMEQGMKFEDALLNTQQTGVAESDHTHDVEGWDAATKTAVLTTVLMDYPLTPQQVTREGIGNLTVDEMQAARASGARIKLVCSAVEQDGCLRATVEPTMLSMSDPLSQLNGTSSGLSLYLDTLKEVFIAGIDHGPEQTAYGLLSDFINIVRRD